MMPMTIMMNNTWNKPVQKCHATGRILWKSTLQKVTNKMKNMNRGTMWSNTGPATRAMPSSIGTLAKTR